MRLSAPFYNFDLLLRGPDLTFASFRRSAAVSTELEIPGDLKADERETVAYDCESPATFFGSLEDRADFAVAYARSLLIPVDVSGAPFLSNRSFGFLD